MTRGPNLEVEPNLVVGCDLELVCVAVLVQGCTYYYCCSRRVRNGPVLQKRVVEFQYP